MAAKSKTLQLPEAPVPVHEAHQQTALETIEAEQWMHSNGWRDIATKLASPRSDEYLTGVHALRLRLRRERTIARRWPIAIGWMGALVALLIGYVIGMLGGGG